MNCDIETTPQAEILREACAGDADALTFLGVWNKTVHEIDDEIDKGLTDPERKLRTMVYLNVAYSTKFYQTYALQLRVIVALITNAYADSVAWEKCVEEAQYRFADVLRFAGNEMVLAVAYITGGYDLMRVISPKLRLASWRAHHNETGKPD